MHVSWKRKSLPSFFQTQEREVDKKMAFSCNIKQLQLLALVWTITWAFLSTESAALITFSGEIGGNVTFPCPVNKQRTVHFFYLQRDSTFVNGYYASRNMPEDTKPWENTIMDRSETAVHMFGLNISHSGKYQCHIQYSDTDKITVTTHLDLNVIAKYSKPTVTTYCKEGNHGYSCLVTCASHGGYPETKMKFTGILSRNSSSQTWKVVNNSQMHNPAIMRFNSSSTAYFNCSHGELEHLSCSVGESTSDMFSVCKPKEHPDPPYPPFVNIALVAVCSLVVIMVGLLLCRKYKKRRAGAADHNVRACAEEVIILNVDTGNKAS